MYTFASSLLCMELLVTNNYASVQLHRLRFGISKASASTVDVEGLVRDHVARGQYSVVVP